MDANQKLVLQKSLLDRLKLAYPLGTHLRPLKALEPYYNLKLNPDDVWVVIAHIPATQFLGVCGVRVSIRQKLGIKDGIGVYKTLCLLESEIQEYFIPV